MQVLLGKSSSRPTTPVEQNLADEEAAAAAQGLRPGGFSLHTPFSTGCGTRTGSGRRSGTTWSGTGLAASQVLEVPSLNHRNTVAVHGFPASVQMVSISGFVDLQPLSRPPDSEARLTGHTHVLCPVHGASGCQALPTRDPCLRG